MIKKSASLFAALGLILTIYSCAPTTINTIPSGATVYRLDGQVPMGTTPYKAYVFLTEKNYTLRNDRYFDEPAKLNFDSPSVLNVKLRPTPVLVYSKPEAQIYPAGSETPLGNTPMKVNVQSKERTYTLKAADYYDQDIKISVAAPDPLIVKMARRPIVTISAAPAGVEVYEKGSLIGAAPVRQEILTSRTFELRKANYFTKSLTLTGAPPYEVSAELKPFPIIAVAASPAGAQIYHGKEVIGKDSVKLAIGEKTALEVRADRYYPQSVILTPESPAQVTVALKEMPYVMINSQPAGAEVFVGGKSVGVAPVEQLIEKDTVIELRKEGYITKTATLTGADKQVTVTLEAVPPPETNAVPPVVATPPAPVAKGSSNLLWLIGGAVAVIAGLVIFLIKRKKK